jgi:hypothetical protein
MKKLSVRITALAGLLPALASAHEGHGLPGLHWHATDVLGFVAVAALIGVAIWTSRK